MSDLPSVEAKIQVEATRFRSAVSEFLAQGIGSSINFLIDENTSQAARLTALEAAGNTVSTGGLTVAITVATGSAVLVMLNDGEIRAASSGTDAVRLRRNGVQISSITIGDATTAPVSIGTLAFIDTSPAVGLNTYVWDSIVGTVIFVGNISQAREFK